MMRFLTTFACLFALVVGAIPCLGAELPRVQIIATGGTIAGAGANSTSGTYTPGKVHIQTLLTAVPELKEVARVSSEQLFAIASQDLQDADWLTLANRVNALLASDTVDGVVITHGTDLMEETAYFLQLTTCSAKPVVLVGSMRPTTSLSADGSLNLYNAVLTAAYPQARGHGVLIVMNGQILHAREATKTNTIHVETFLSPNTGPLGEVYGSQITFKHGSLRQPTENGQPLFDVSALKELPQVGIVYGHGNSSPVVVQALLDARFQGIVYAGVGNGNIHKNVLPLLIQAAKAGVSIVRSSRVATGPTTLHGEIDDDLYGFVASGDLPPHKARILLMLALTKTHDRTQIQDYFNRY